MKYRYVYTGIMIVVCAGIVWYTQYYMPKHRTTSPSKENISTAIIKEIKFVPAHEKQTRYITSYSGTGRYRVPIYSTRNYHVGDAYTIKVYIKDINKESSYNCFNLSKGKEYKVGNEVKVKYKVDEVYFVTTVYISDMGNLQDSLK